MDHYFEKGIDGNLKISDEVISTIARTAAKETDGVCDLSIKGASDIKGIINKKFGGSKGVKVEFVDETVNIDVYISVYYNSVLPEIAKRVQENVKSAVETMTGIVVNNISVTINGITEKK